MCRRLLTARRTADKPHNADSERLHQRPVPDALVCPIMQEASDAAASVRERSGIAATVAGEQHDFTHEMRGRCPTFGGCSQSLDQEPD